MAIFFVCNPGKIPAVLIKAGDYQKLLDFKKQVMVDVNEKIVMQKK